MSDSIVCHDCGLALSAPAQQRRGEWFCPRCRARLGSSHRIRVEAVAALALAALVLWAPAMFLPLLSMDQFGLYNAVSVFSCVTALFSNGYPLVAALVAVTLLVMPLAQLLALLVTMARLRGGVSLGRWVWWYRQGREWAMPEIFLLGALIATTKLGENATLHLQAGLICLLAMVVLRLIAEALANPAALDRVMERRHDPAR
ncbi:paraquat-inducible protein A [Alloalcanivorax mobilis]|uniref:paraquat-inducible protein A n=1 Tax=Alloalcanivorax mobilis TaxID=2019569 RepID=UPI000B5B0EF7|nr:paraquat-inducible protein A [Alloalcanivorax mobilis]ASK35593.1 paraquat-inducible membrane protein A [Alcanivorax sp. N3-2A]|tara:strand:- start:19308 stop:19913 length:606 start_codon:yes stop_codon:yes gene_type:complete